MSGIVRSITHWTAGGGRASALDKEHYHRITERDGTIVEGKEEIEDNIVVSDGDYAAHTLRLNTGSAGFAMAGMVGAEEEPFDPGTSPLTERQFEAHCKMLAEFHMAYGIPISGRTCLTHAEVEPVLGVKQRGKWDITRLPWRSDIRGAVPVGNFMRERVRSYLVADFDATHYNASSRPVLREGDQGPYVTEAQRMLARLGFHSGKSDGIFGTRTRQAVISAQTHYGLTPDGIVGPQTWSKIGSSGTEAMPERDVSKSDLREAGSKTVKSGDRVKIGAISATTLTGAATVAKDFVTTNPTELGNARSNLGLYNQIVTDYWPLLVVLGFGVVLWVIAEHFQLLRVDEARKGENLSK